MQTNDLPSGATRPGNRRTMRGVATLAAVALAGSILAPASLAILNAAPAGASTLDGTATIDVPGTTGPLTSGGSATTFTVALPPNAACDGDTASNGYHVYSYLLKPETPATSVTFISTPSEGLGIFDTTGHYYGAVNTAIGTGQIVSIPNDFSWAPLVTGDGLLSTLLYTPGASKKKPATGVWEAGIACATSSGVVKDYWNTTVTFTGSTTDPNGFTWTDVPQLNILSPTTLPTATIGTPYSTTLSIVGGTPPYKIALLKDGAKLPKGLKLNKKTGAITGTVNAKKGTTGTTTFTVTVTDKGKKKTNSQETATATFSLPVVAAS